MAVRSLKNSTLENFANYSSSMNAGYSFQDYELIESVFLASNASSVSFNNLSQYATEYKHLQLRILMRTNTASEVGMQSVLTLNGNTTSSLYASHTLQGNGSTVFSQSIAGTFPGIAFTLRHPASNGVAGAFAAGIIDFIDAYSTTKNKTIKVFQGMAQTENNINLNSGLFASTNSITSVTFQPQGANGDYVAGSRFSLYGIR